MQGEALRFLEAVLQKRALQENTLHKYNLVQLLCREAGHRGVAKPQREERSSTALGPEDRAQRTGGRESEAKRMRQREGRGTKEVCSHSRGPGLYLRA